MHNFTTEDLIQFLYKETSPGVTAAIKTALISDWTLREQYDILKASQSELENVKMLSPRNRTIENILNYAEKSVEELSEKA